MGDLPFFWVHVFTQQAHAQWADPQLNWKIIMSDADPYFILINGQSVQLNQNWDLSSDMDLVFRAYLEIQGITPISLCCHLNYLLLSIN